MGPEPAAASFGVLGIVLLLGSVGLLFIRRTRRYALAFALPGFALGLNQAWYAIGRGAPFATFLLFFAIGSVALGTLLVLCTWLYTRWRAKGTRNELRIIKP